MVPIFLAAQPEALAAKRRGRVIRGRVCGMDPVRFKSGRTMFLQASYQPRSVPFELKDDFSHIDWAFERADGWFIVTGSQFHQGDDYYADDCAPRRRGEEAVM